MLVNNGVSLGTRYEELFHNYSLVDLLLGASFDNGTSFDVTYAVNEGQLFVYEYQVTKNGNMFAERMIANESLSVNGMTFPKAFKHLDLQESEMVFRADYIGPIRKTAPKEVTFEGYNSIPSVGIDGAAAYSALLNSHLKGAGLFENVSQWFEENLEGQGRGGFWQ